MPRQRSAAVRYASKEAADSDKLLVKANRTLHVDVCCSHDHSKNTRSIAAAVGIQGWRKTMEDAHVVWLKRKNKNKNNNNSKHENDEDQEHPPRFFRSFVSGPIDCEHASTAATRRSSTATTALHADDSSTATPSTESVQQREASPAPATIYTTTAATTTGQMPHQHSVLMNNNSNNFTTSPSCSMMNNAMIDLLGDPAYLPNNNNNNSNHVGISTVATTTTTPSTSATTSMNASPIRSPASANPSVHASTTNNNIPTSQDLSHELDELSEGTSIEGFVAVFDGHGGDAASKYCCSKLGKLLFQEIRQLIISNNEKDKSNTNTSSSSSSISSSPFTDEELQTAFNKAFLECDDQLRNHFASIQNAEALERSMNNNNNNGETPPTTNSYLESYASPLLPGNTTNAGSTAAGALILQNQIVLFSVGDCRSGVFAQKRKNNNENNTTTSSSLIKQEAENNNNKNSNNDDDDDNFFSQFEILGKLDQDHRPGGSSAIETERLSKIPSAQVVNGRVQGKLAVSRAFGDFNFKPLDNSVSSSTEVENDPLLQFPVVCIPEITVISRQQQQQQHQNCTPLLIAIGCDGVFETQELKKLPDLIVGPAQQQQQQVGTESSTGEGEGEGDTQSSSSPPPSLSVYGAVKVAQRSISKIQPLSEQGGLLPGSDNVTFITVYLDEHCFSFIENNDNNNNNNNSNERVLTTTSSKQGEEESSSNAPLIISPREKAKQCC